MDSIRVSLSKPTDEPRQPVPEQLHLGHRGIVVGVWHEFAFFRFSLQGKVGQLHFSGETGVHVKT